jgi:hypothetical protein
MVKQGNGVGIRFDGGEGDDVAGVCQPQLQKL